MTDKLKEILVHDLFKYANCGYTHYKILTAPNAIGRGLGLWIGNKSSKEVESAYSVSVINSWTLVKRNHHTICSKCHSNE